MHLPQLRILVCIVMLVSLSSAAGQTPKLSIGDALPDFEFKNVLNDKRSHLKLSDFKGKCIILEFWNHNCHYCLASFNNIDSIQKKFGDRLQVILVNKEDRAFTERFFKDKPQIRKPGVPLATGSGTFIDHFPKDGYPYSVWIDANGIIREMALAHNLTEKHIREFTEGQSLHLKDATQKKFYGPLFNYKSDSLEKKIGYFSCITRYIDDLNIGFSENSNYNDALAEISSSGSSVVELYKKAYREGDKYNFNEEGSVILNVRNRWPYVRPTDANEKDNWERQYSYNYTLFLPLRNREDGYKIMQEDLRRYFGLKARVISNTENEKPLHVLVIEE